jgi:hypothetical protein
MRPRGNRRLQHPGSPKSRVSESWWCQGHMCSISVYPFDMRTGALAMIDALGFKGIWARPEIKADSKIILDKLRLLEAITRRGVDAFVNYITPNSEPSKLRPYVNATFLSDTAVIGVELAPDNPAGVDLACVGVAAAVITNILVEAVSSEPRLLYRGCITYGDFDMASSFIVGPAVDECAELYETAEGAFVWLSPSARHVVDNPTPHTGEMLTSLYPVPLKSGVFETYAVNPFGKLPAQPSDDANALIRNFEAAFGEPRDVAVEIKRRNTRAFLAHAEKCLRMQ